jgi:hypothetical protein
MLRPHSTRKRGPVLPDRPRGFSEPGAGAQAVSSEATAIQGQEQGAEVLGLPLSWASHDLYNRAVEVFWL